MIRSREIIGQFISLKRDRKPGSVLIFKKDLYCLCYLLTVTLLFFGHWHCESIYWPLIIIACLMNYGVGCIQHNQAHLPMWHSSTLNSLTDIWIGLLRGDGVWSWIPTHCHNHHRYVNRRGDLTLTWRFSHKQHVGQLIMYTIHAGVAYGYTALRFLLKQFLKRPRYALLISVQLTVYTIFLIASWKTDPSKTCWLIIVPQSFGILAMLATGYMQHHHTNSASSWDHSRNFTGQINNILHFNHGFHTVHHLDESLHWSEWPIAHHNIKHRINPQLNQPSLPRYLFPAFHSFDIQIYKTCQRQ